MALTRNSSSTGCSSAAVSVSVAGSARAGAGDDLVEQLLEPVGEHGDLLLLQRDGDDARAVGGLQEERAVAGRADGARDEAPRAFEQEELARHDAVQPTCDASDGQTLPRRRHRRPSRRRRACARRRFFGGTNAARSQPVSLVRSTYGRWSV